MFMEEDIKYNRHLIEENLPDFVFGKLSSVESMNFEKALKNFPDLCILSDELKSTYSNIKLENIDRIAHNATKEMPSAILSKVRVNEPKSVLSFLTKSLAYSFSAVAIAAFLYFVLPSSFWNKELIENSGAPKIVSFTDNELQEFENDYPLDFNVNNPSKVNNFTEEEYIILNDYSEDFYSSIFENESEKKIQEHLVPSENYDKSENSYLDLINENELQEILQEIENVNFKTNN